MGAPAGLHTTEANYITLNSEREVMPKWHNCLSNTYPKPCVQVLKALKEKYGNLYRQDNVVLSGTHTHCGPAGYFQYTLFMITSKGYIKESIQPLVNGIVKVGHFFWSISTKIVVTIGSQRFFSFPFFFAMFDMLLPIWSTSHPI